MSIKGYKVFNPDWTCRGFQYEVGKTFEHNGDIEMCGAGFHFCRKLSDCFGYYSFNSNNKVAEVEAVGLVETEGDKSVTNKIRIVKELTWHDVLDMCNTGKDCTGNRNSGNRNSGDCNSGNRNSGDCNSGDCNSGDWNSGDCNSGDWNSSNRNSGNWNSGNWNKCNYSAGYFNTSDQPFFAFNTPLSFDRDEFLRSKGIRVLNWNYENNWWIYSKNMTNEEKKAHPEHETTGGYLKTVDFKIACKMMWDNLDDEDKQAVREIPNFDADVFEEITGIKVND